MDPNRPSDPTAAPNNQQQQNVHLHMHHICNCQGGLYPTAAAAAAAAYYPTTVGYRTPLPSILPYHHHTSSAAAAAVAARPYLQHYQYTQFNVGSQYTVPIGHVSGSSSTSVYASGPAAAAAAGASSTIDLVYAGAAAIKEKQRGEEGGGGDLERSNEVPPEGFDFGQVTPPAHELLVTDASDSSAHHENFIKFLERSCLTAEQIAYRNRNRPCFRNIQNLCIRTRSEILKPCTTISNIHSQGIPWATKDFIYAFVRLTNCWHILKGYWENRDGLSLGKIEKELTPEFRSCYMRWEKESMELAGELAKIFYNLDTNLNTASSGAGVYAANNMIPPQINLMKSSASEGTIKNKQQQQTGGNDAGNGAAAKNVRGILHLPGNGGGATVAETVDQANQTYAGDFCHNDEEYDSEGERTRRVYMKPGSYSVPKKGLEAATSSVGGAVGGSNSPRAIEFLETAQNVNKARETVSERYWANIQLSNVTKKAEQQQQQQQQKEYHILEEEMEEEARLNLSAHINVHEWLINSNFGDFGEAKSPHAHQELKSFYLDSVYDSLPQLDSPVSGDGNGAAVTLLQRTKSMQVPSKLVNVQKQTPIGSAGRLIRKQQQQQQQKASSGGAATALPMMEMAPRRLLNPYELKGGGLTEAAQCVLENLVGSLKGHVLGPLALDGEDLEKILQKIKNLEYSYVNEVVRDLRYFIKIWEEIDIHNVGWFSQKLDILLVENFSPFDFSGIAGLLNEIVGPLKHNVLTLFGNDCDPF
ncbi:uncharacterized protein LOC126746888 isoform X2 [Anthonomus grandis grandis]|uniref:uncharacterized protein LOC126746888 isoform X2 n=1 Tax=Anthonomus grandis grandis TaxID=2921223 RepID=UPI002165F92B|nr:uncharacterized protein LOC126746888 isoform X2 [Anthonomus grandis grandis]